MGMIHVMNLKAVPLREMLLTTQLRMFYLPVSSLKAKSLKFYKLSFTVFLYVCETWSFNFVEEI